MVVAQNSCAQNGTNISPHKPTESPDIFPKGPLDQIPRDIWHWVYPEPVTLNPDMEIDEAKLATETPETSLSLQISFKACLIQNTTIQLYNRS